MMTNLIKSPDTGQVFNAEPMTPDEHTSFVEIEYKNNKTVQEFIKETDNSPPMEKYYYLFYSIDKKSSSLPDDIDFYRVVASNKVWQIIPEHLHGKISKDVYSISFYPNGRYNFARIIATNEVWDILKNSNWQQYVKSLMSF